MWLTKYSGRIIRHPDDAQPILLGFSRCARSLGAEGAGGDVEIEIQVQGLVARAEYTVQLVVQSADGVWPATPLHKIAAGPDETVLQVQLQLPAEVLRARVTAPVTDIRIHLVDGFPGLGEGESLLATMPLPDRARLCAASG
jgi:hypothetical protein